VSPGAVGDLVRERVSPKAGAAVATRLELACQRLRGRPGVTEEREVRGAVEPDRPSLHIDLDDLGVGADKRAVLGCPMVDRGAEHEHHVSLGNGFCGER
jgi:hypothetical protein